MDKCANLDIETSVWPSYSRSGLIDQLEYQGFTTTQTEYGVAAVGYE